MCVGGGRQDKIVKHKRRGDAKKNCFDSLKGKLIFIFFHLFSIAFFASSVARLQLSLLILVIGYIFFPIFVDYFDINVVLLSYA